MVPICCIFSERTLSVQVWGAYSALLICEILGGHIVSDALRLRGSQPFQRYTTTTAAHTRARS